MISLDPHINYTDNEVRREHTIARSKLGVNMTCDLVNLMTQNSCWVLVCSLVGSLVQGRRMKLPVDNMCHSHSYCVFNSVRAFLCMKMRRTKLLLWYLINEIIVIIAAHLLSLIWNSTFFLNVAVCI